MSNLFDKTRFDTQWRAAPLLVNSRGPNSNTLVYVKSTVDLGYVNMCAYNCFVSEPKFTFFAQFNLSSFSIYTAIYSFKLSTIYRLDAIPHDWHTIVCYDPSRSCQMISMSFESQCDFLLAINSILGTISQHLATIHPWETDGWTTTMKKARPLLKYGWLKN